MKLKRICCALFAVAAVVSVTACKREVKSNTNYVATADDKQWLEHIEIEDMDGYNFRIFTRKGMTSDQYNEDQTGDVINDAVYKRNETVKGLFNIDITAVESSSDDSSTVVLNNILAGDDEYDIILPHSRTAFQYATQRGALVNFLEVDTIDLSQDWWSQDIIDSCNVNNNLYVLDGDIQTHRLKYAFTMYFNKRIFDDLGLEYPYQMVKNGTWTFDEFSKLVKQGSKDLNGDGLLDQKSDQFGYYTRDWFGPIQVLYSGGQRIYSKDATGTPKLSLNSAKTIEIFSKFFELANSDNVFMQLDKERMADEDLFAAGRAMFADRDLGAAQELRSMDDEFGILPWPKFTQSDEYATVVNGHASLLIMPTTVEDYNKTGKVIEALCAIGNRDVIPAFYDVSLKTKFARDVESEEMIDIIKNSLIYDLGYVSGGTFQSAGYDLAHQTNPDFASYYAQNESLALSKLGEFLESYGGIK